MSPKKDMTVLIDTTGKTGFIKDGDWVLSSDMDSSGKIRLLQLADIGEGVFLNKSSKYINEAKLLELKGTLIKEGDLLISRMPEPIGRACVIPNLNEKAVVAVDISILRIDPNYSHANYIKHICNSSYFRREVEKFARGTTRIRITRKKLEKIKIPLPPLDIQKKIATVLDKADQLRQKRKKTIEKLDQLIQSMFFDMFGDPVTNPRGWELKKIENISVPTKRAIKCGPFGSQLLIGEYVDSGIPVYGIDNVQQNNFVWAKPKFITEEKFNQLKSFSIQPGDVLISRTGTVGRTCIAPPSIPKSIIGPNLLKVSLNLKKMKPIILSLALNYSKSLIQMIKRMSPGATVAVFNTTNLKALKIPVPSYNEQLLFETQYIKYEKQKDYLIKNQILLNNLFNSLLQKAFKGELKFNDKAFKELEEETLN